MNTDLFEAEGWERLGCKGVIFLTVLLTYLRDIDTSQDNSYETLYNWSQPSPI